MDKRTKKKAEEASKLEWLKSDEITYEAAELCVAGRMTQGACNRFCEVLEEQAATEDGESILLVGADSIRVTGNAAWKAWKKIEQEFRRPRRKTGKNS